MKKTIVSILALVMILSMVLIPVSAAEANTILTGTPTVDGKLDDIYAQSWSGAVDTSKKIWVADDYADNDIAATVYMLHDDAYLYICGVVTGDSNVVDSKSVSWATDGLDIWLSSYAVETEMGAYSKLPLSAYGDALATSGAIGDFDNGLHIDHTQSVVAATQTEGGYTVEAKIPLDALYYDVEHTSIAVNLQLNNIASADENGGNTTAGFGFFGEQWNKKTGDTGLKLTLSSETVTVPETPTEAPTETGKPDTSNPKDGDTVSVFVALMAVSAIGAAVILKKKEF